MKVKKYIYCIFLFCNGIFIYAYSHMILDCPTATSIKRDWKKQQCTERYHICSLQCDNWLLSAFGNYEKKFTIEPMKMSVVQAGCTVGVRFSF